MPNFMGRVAKINGELQLVVEQNVDIAQAMPAPSKDCKMPRQGAMGVDIFLYAGPARGGAIGRRDRPL